MQAPQRVHHGERNEKQKQEGYVGQERIEAERGKGLREIGHDGEGSQEQKRTGVPSAGESWKIAAFNEMEDSVQEATQSDVFEEGQAGDFCRQKRMVFQGQDENQNIKESHAGTPWKADFLWSIILTD
jgi:hypothetical protein